MKRIVLVFGLIAGAIMSAMMLINMQLMEAQDFDKSEVLGYASIVLAFMLIFFGIRAYRENEANGAISFGRAFRVGALIALVASVCYVATWQVIYYRLAPDFMDRFAAHEVEKARASGATPQEIEKKRAQMQKFSELYENPVFNAGITFVEPLPIGLIVALVSAGILRRKRTAALSDGAGDPELRS